jgi:WD40 repeat protein
MKLAIMPTMVRWSTCGSRYLVFSDNQISIYSIENENGPIIAKIKSRARINCGVCVKVKWQGEKEDVDVVVYGGEDKILRIACVKTGRILLNLATRHTLRIKDAAALYRPSASSSIVSTCSSEGLVMVWDLEKVLDLQPDASELQDDATIIHSIEESAHTIVAEYDCKCRVTCLAIGTGDTGDEKKRILERGRAEEAARLAKLNEMPESDWEQDEKLKSELAARKKVSVVVDDDDSIHLASSTRVSKNPTATTGSVTIISREKNPKVAKKMKKKKAKLQRE